MSVAWWLNTAWMHKCRHELRAFERATHDVAAAQQRILREIVSRNAATAFGAQHKFSLVGSGRDLQHRVPLATYDTLRPWIDRAAAAEPNVLTREPVRLFEPTSGTTRGEKLIPYTASLRQQFQRGIAAWIADLFDKRPAVRQGRAYWSISPVFSQQPRTSGGIAVGFDDDASYLGGLEQFALRRLLVAPTAVSGLAGIECFRYATLLHLLEAEDLALMSLWNPSFLPRLFDGLEHSWQRICHDLRHGFRWDAGLKLRPNPRRAQTIDAVCRSTSQRAERLRQLWPNLALVSCWADASAAALLPELRSLLPEVEIQPKGLLATECFVSLPLIDQPAPALAIRSHFFEFLPSGAGPVETPLLAHQLDRGAKYRVVVTTGGGLYRYQLNDEIEVVGRHHECPLMRFTGKTDQTSDLVGEKLSEPHVRAVLERVFATCELTPRFVLLTPVAWKPPRYRLYLQLPEQISPPAVSRIAADLQQALEENPHYRYAIGLRQLMPLEVAILDPACRAAQRFESGLLARGQRLGGIKPAFLDGRIDWEDVYAPLTITLVQAADRSTRLPPANPATVR